MEKLDFRVLTDDIFLRNLHQREPHHEQRKPHHEQRRHQQNLLLHQDAQPQQQQRNRKEQQQHSQPQELKHHEQNLQEQLQELQLEQQQKPQAPSVGDMALIYRAEKPMLKDFKELPCNDLAKDVENNFDFVRFTFSDIHGIGRCRLIPSHHFNGMINDGVQIYSGAVSFGPRSQQILFDEILTFRRGNVVLRPFIESLVLLPWATMGEFRIGEVLCETLWGPLYNRRVLMKERALKVASESGTEQTNLTTDKSSNKDSRGNNVKEGQDDDALTPQEACPRFVARRLLEQLEKEFGLTLFSSFEAEFTCYKQGTLQPVFSNNDYSSTNNTSEFESYLARVYKGLNVIGVDVEALQTEFEAGQFELAISPSKGISAADGMFRVKHAVKEMSKQQGMDATFMTKPDHTVKSSSNGLHFNHSLLDNKTEKNVMYDSDDRDKMSDVARWWLAGLLKHSPALTALCSPTVNCYRRLNSGPAPAKINWGLDDRFACHRIKTTRGPNACTYMENRLPSGSANPYLVMAATLAAGISGLAQKLECPRENSPDALELPKSLQEALTCLEEDEIMVKALGESFVKWFVRVKREIEIAKLKENRIELEREMYMTLL